LSAPDDCWTCRKLGALAIVPGGEIASDEHVVVTHLPLTTPVSCSAAVPLGHLLVETRRHVTSPGPDEAASARRWADALARALDGPVDVQERDGEHFGVEVVARDAPRGDAQAVIAFAERLRRTLDR
jgi:hypothetical protein